MDLIEVLWKQDVDLGFNPPHPTNTASIQKEKKVEEEVETLNKLLTEKVEEKVRNIFYG